MTEQHQADLRPQQPAESGDPYPGQDLGFPRSGPGSMSPMARRLGALIADWLLCSLVAAAFIRVRFGTPHYWTELRDWSLLVFAVQDVIFTGLLGGTIGKRFFRLRVLRVDGRILGLGWALVRTLLLLCIVPPLVQGHDLRGLHDRAADAAVTMM